MASSPKKAASAIRLHKYIAQAGLASRREAERWIQQGRVRVNGRAVTQLGVSVDPSVDRVEVDGRVVKAQQQKVVLLLHKPRYCLTTVKDPQGRPTVMDVLGPVPWRVFPVGRLDWDATGALILTNDGDLANRLLHPRYGVPKTYEVKVQGIPSQEALERLRTGVRLEEGITAPAGVEVLRRGPKATWLRIVLHQGWYRRIKRMGQAVGCPVLKIHRTAYGPIGLGSLGVGRWRHVKSLELNRLTAEIKRQGNG
ncbi:ribosomal large subunit pseudouridine synthase B [Desulfacinum hydrothermale DSM 13146]|uniref:Pseudouridine synthase n=1 Tax=Desulfacinum hydrothermale DSM 13146 TaxID=1121390 RepID=A0A1W1XI19_9BACT|nr:pseudouridine synthase [Desulfacinum hydrothermale]SMC23151.1 ribosomal large subunit pseudouridine synthase B [Desulfacinum hydrothermale DSM 13146]